MTLWRVPEDEGDGYSASSTELVVRADTREEAIARARAYMTERLKPYPGSSDRHLYDETEPIEGDVYDVPMYGYSW